MATGAPARGTQGDWGWEIWNQSPLCMAQVDLKGSVLHLNSLLAAMLGGSAEDFIGRPAAEVLPGLTCPMEEQVRKVLWPSAGPALAIRVAAGEGGTTVLAFVVEAELPRVAHLLAEASAAQAELESVIQASFDEIFITDGEGRVVQVNAACERLYGLPREALLGRNVRELQGQGLFNVSSTAQVLRTRERQTVVQETNTGRRLVTTSSPVFGPDGSITRVVSVARDVTDLNRLTEQLGETEALAQRYRTELHLLNSHLKRDEAMPIFASRAMQEVLDMVRRVASVDAAVLITGESGVGKGQLARLFHRWSNQPDGPFQTIDCGALPESLIESELFGYERGAFTGADREGKKGLIEWADGGTLFLDEIGELPLGLQVKLLRFLQERTVTRVGGRQPKEVGVRVLAATNRDLRVMVAQGKFREDLFYRLNVVPIHLRPLRERPEDIPVLLDYFLAGSVAKYRRTRTISQEAMTALCRYPWPGNVRELENLVVRMVVTSPDQVIRPQDLPEEVMSRGAAPAEHPVLVTELLPFEAAQAEMERQLLTMAMQRSKTTREIARLLGVNQSTIVRRMKQFFPDRQQLPD